MSDDVTQFEQRFDRGAPPWLKYTTVVGLMIVAALVLVIVFNPSLDQPTKAKGVGAPMPELSLAPLVGNPPRIDSNALKGHITLINFWGTWCKPCVMELPDLLEVREFYSKNPRFRFLPVVCSPGVEEDVEALRKTTTAFLAERKIDLPSYCDPDGATRNELSKQIDFIGYPTTVLVDEDGVIRAVWSGVAERRELDEALAKYVK